MRTIALAILILTALYIGCSDNTFSPSENTNLSSTLTGKLEDWTFGDSLKLRAELWVQNINDYYILDSCFIQSNGSFSIKLKTPPDYALSVFRIEWDSSCTGNVVIEPSNTKTSSFITFRIYSSYSDSFPLGYVSRHNPRDTSNWTKPGDFEVGYIYANNNASITGTEICTNAWFFPDTTIFEVNGIKGWNKIVYNYLSYSSSSVKMLVNSTEPAGGKWYAQMYFDSKLHDSKKSFQFINKCFSCQKNVD